jgi:ribulose-phosphate 3-epimerase
MSVEISASLLASDLTRLSAEVAALTKANVDRLHFDIMDGHFVPNLAFGPDFLKALRPSTHIPFEAHLMITPVEPYIETFAFSGADIIFVHPESGLDINASLGKIRHFNKKAGIVLNPSTSAEVIINLLDKVDQVLVMTVTPGFSGQRFLKEQLPKIKKVRELIGDRLIDLVVDGGITPEIAPQVVAAGANVLVAGNAIFHNRDLKNNINALRSAI